MDKLNKESIQSTEYPGQNAYYKELPSGIVSLVSFHIVPEYIGRESGKLDTILDTVSIETASGTTFFRSLVDYDSTWVLLKTL